MPDPYAEHKERLLKLATDAIDFGLVHHRVVDINVSEYPSILQANRATFVTLYVNDQLRGCIGNLEATRPLVEDLVHNAFAAAFRDPRFAPLSREEFKQIDIHLSILSPLEPISYTSEDDLIEQLQPHKDGLVLEDGVHRGTFLPAVWKSLPTPQSFFSQLKRKAGLADDHWSETLTVKRYTVTELSAPTP